jgi:hypothetical protein
VILLTRHLCRVFYCELFPLARLLSLCLCDDVAETVKIIFVSKEEVVKRPEYEDQNT